MLCKISMGESPPIISLSNNYAVPKFRAKLYRKTAIELSSHIARKSTFRFCADERKAHPRAPPCAVSRFSLPADSLNLPFLWPVSLFLLQPQIPFLTAPSRGATSKGWPQIAACCSFQCQDRCLLLHPGGCQCHSGASGAYCWQQNREWGPIEGHTAQDTAEVLYTSLFFCYTKLFYVI